MFSFLRKVCQEPLGGIRQGTPAWRHLAAVATIAVAAAGVLTAGYRSGGVGTLRAPVSPVSPVAADSPDATGIPGGEAAGNPLAGVRFYDDPDSQADAAATRLRGGDPANAGLLDKITNTPQALWLGDWFPTAQVRATVAARVGSARAAQAIAVFAVYHIPARDCGGYSAGGAGSPDEYRAWISEVAAGIGTGPAVVILEPDAIAGADCLPAADQQTRYTLIREAGTLLTQHGATVYLDAGQPDWRNATEMAGRLRLAGVTAVRGFALNTANFVATTDLLAYGNRIVAELGGSGHFVVDTSRNGYGPAPDKQWCNPPGRALGARPTTQTGDEHADAFLWVKGPGESDGTCNGGPPAGRFWPAYALDLARRAPY
ncbi:glycoside hydrolase family 6 protein [Candidatus Protofrankia datiscae]|uniref:Glucanase n=1 Tax=Candidatus Protofrankia datiscae TaxID=2716812 RepID=F8AWI5_9ACTN|nr:glycoside hydrolase family 6 protein [Candidatus Protofrankia datiscae]AEH08390.1 Cellulase [Candidatus Protofrankia datiscae]